MICTDDLWHRVTSTISICNTNIVYIFHAEFNYLWKVGKLGAPQHWPSKLTGKHDLVVQTTGKGNK